MSIMWFSLNYYSNFPRDWHVDLYYGFVYNENNFFVFVIFLKYCHPLNKENIFLIFLEGILVRKIGNKLQKAQFVSLFWHCQKSKCLN